MTKSNQRFQAAAILGSLALAGSALAGPAAPVGKTVVPPPPAPESTGLFDTVGATLDVGYDSHYIFRGALISEENVWTQLAINIPLAEKVSLGIGAWYTSSTDISYDELDLSGGVTYDAGFAKFGAGYTWYKYFDGSLGEGLGDDDAQELGATIAVPVGPVNLTSGYFYDFNTDGAYLELGAEAPIAITDNFSIVPAAAVSYGFDYYAPEDGFQHIKVGVSFPIKLTSTATLTPYIAGNIPLDTYEDYYDDEVYGGVKLSVSF